MASRTIAIIGAGMGGLAAGIHARRNGYRTLILEAHRLPGGQCASWKRKGYTFDVCIHHLFGCEPGSRLHALWSELGAMPRDLVPTREVVSVADFHGRQFDDLYDPDTLAEHLKTLAPGDAAMADEYVAAIRRTARADLFGETLVGTPWGIARALPSAMSTLGIGRHAMGRYAQRFKDPFLRAAFPLLEYSMPEAPMFMHLAKHAYGMRGGIRWPVGASLAFARSIERTYLDLGGEIRYASRVSKILVRNDRACGVRLEDGTEIPADVVISDADGRKTIRNLLDGRYTDDTLRAWCGDPPDEGPWAVHVFLGVERDLSREPSALVLLLDEPTTIAGHSLSSLEMQTYGMDPTMAPQGHGVIKVELVSKWSYWNALAADRARYDEEKARVVDQVLDVLERRWPGIRADVRAVDVPTLMTWERYMGGTHGFNNAPSRPFDPLASLTGRMNLTLPGLRDFWFVGIWATGMGALFVNALSGRKVVQRICRQDGKRFVA